MDDKSLRGRIDASLKIMEGKELTPEEVMKQSDLLAIKGVMRWPNWEQMHFFLIHCLLRLEKDECLSLEVLQFVFGRLLEASAIAHANPKARNNPIASAVYLSGRGSSDLRHFDMTIKICDESFRYRHKPDAIDLATKALPLKVKYETAKGIVKKWKPYAMAHLVTITTDSRKRDYFRKQLSPEDRGRLLLESQAE